MIPLSFLIGGNGHIYEGRGWNVQGAHTQGYNNVGYGICFLENFMNVSPTQRGVGACQKLLKVSVDCLSPSHTSSFGVCSRLQ